MSSIGVGIDVDLESVDSAYIALARITRIARIRWPNAMMIRGGNQIAEIMKEEAPVLSGKLRDSITVDKVPDMVMIYPDVEYLKFVVFATKASEGRYVPMIDARLSFLSAAKRASERTARAEGLEINEDVTVKYNEPVPGHHGLLGSYSKSTNEINVYMKGRVYLPIPQEKQSTTYHEHLHANIEATKKVVYEYARDLRLNRQATMGRGQAYQDRVARAGAALRKIEQTPTRREIQMVYPSFQYAEESWVREKEKGPEDEPRSTENLIDIGMHPGTGENDFMDRTWERAMIELDPTIERIVDEGLNNAFGFE